jgi:NAD(P)H-dependent FMN reductase
MSIKLLGISGSTRTASLNRRLLRACLHRAEAEGAETTLIDLKALDIPLYDGDLEEASGLPAGARELRNRLIEADGLLIASPEYNGSFSAVLKNAIDWTTRPDSERPDDPSLVAWRGRVAGLISATPGGMGGIRGLIQLRTVLSGIGVHVVPTQLGVGTAHEVVTEDGTIEHDGWRDRVAGLVDEVVSTASRLKAD